MTMTVTAADVRAQYPNPQSPSGDKRLLGFINVQPLINKFTGGPYCVGGALVKSYNKGADGFPNLSQITTQLKTCNVALDYEKAFRYADEIVALNDQGAFEQAWQALEQALAYTGD